MAGLDWPGLLRLGLSPRERGGLGLTPAAFWRLSPIELQLMLGRDEAGAGPMRRTGLEQLMASYPDTRIGDQGGDDDGS